MAPVAAPAPPATTTPSVPTDASASAPEPTFVPDFAGF